MVQFFELLESSLMIIHIMIIHIIFRVGFIEGNHRGHVDIIIIIIGSTPVCC